jgi:hypothetical protein
MKDRLRIFVAGPYCPYGADLHDASRLAQRNVDQAIEIANAIHDKGHYAFVPHLTHYLHIHYSCKKDRGIWYYDYDNSFLDIWATALFFIAESPGANNEKQRAIGRDLIVFTNLNQIPKLERGL